MKKIISITLVGTLGILVSGCFQIQKEEGSFSSYTGYVNEYGEPISTNIKTMSFKGTTRVVKSYEKMTGLSNLLATNSSVRNAYERKKNTLSLEGETHTISAPVWMSFIDLGGAVCQSFVRSERDKAEADRLVFNDVNFSASPSRNTEAIKTVVEKMAKRFWSRLPSSEETSDIVATVQQHYQNVTTNNPINTEQMMLFTCTAMIASYSAVEN